MANTTETLIDRTLKATSYVRVVTTLMALIQFTHNSAVGKAIGWLA